LDGSTEAAQVPESLFDDLRRTDDRPALFDEPTFRFLNRRAGIVWQRVRDLLDELYCHEALRGAGWGLEHHPLLAHTSRRPDLRASRDSVIAYVEVTTTSTPQLDEAATARLNTVIDKINDRIEVDQFSLGMEVLNVGNTAPATEPLCARLQSWLADLDADQIITRGAPALTAGSSSSSGARAAGAWSSRLTPYRLTAVVPAAGSSARPARLKRSASMT
jgi:hypothetical protein